MAQDHPGAARVIDFWFNRHGHEDWFGAKPEFDEALRAEFGEDLKRAQRGEFWVWRQTLPGRLAEIIMLDQFTRQLHRGQARAFASDGMALVLAQELISQNGFDALEQDWRFFAFLPFMHSESIAIQDESIRLYTALGDDDALKYALAHRDTIQRFGRYPKRNAALGRESTPEEIAYMDDNEGRMF